MGGEVSAQLVVLFRTSGPGLGVQWEGSCVYTAFSQLQEI